MKRSILFAATLTVAGLGLASSAEAGWRADHPRRAEVNARLANQDRRIHQERKEGEITAVQAHDLHAQDRAIRAQERTDASLHNSHITRAEQAQLNQEENQVSKQIGR
jgi:hypothetical protein